MSKNILSVLLVLVAFFLFAVVALLLLRVLGGVPDRSDQALVMEEGNKTASLIEDTNSKAFSTRNTDSGAEALLGNATNPDANINSDEEADLLLNAASLKIRNNPEEAISLLGQVYAGDYSEIKKAKSLHTLFWHIAAHTIDTEVYDGVVPVGRQSVAEINELVFTNPVFNALSPETLPSTRAEVVAIALSNLETSLSLTDEQTSLFYLSGAAVLAEWYPELYGNTEVEMTDEEIVGKVQQAHALAKDYIDVVRKDLLVGEYTPMYANSLYSLFKGSSWLVNWGELESSEALQYHTELTNHITQANDGGFLKSVIHGVSGYRAACEVVTFANYEIDQIDETQVINLLEPFYLLEEEDYQRRSAIRAYAEKTDHKCHKATILIGSSIDPRLKETLVNKVGGWTNADFESN